MYLRRGHTCLLHIYSVLTTKPPRGNCEVLYTQICKLHLQKNKGWLCLPHKAGQDCLSMGMHRAKRLFIEAHDPNLRLLVNIYYVCELSACTLMCQ